MGFISLGGGGAISLFGDKAPQADAWLLPCMELVLKKIAFSSG